MISILTCVIVKAHYWINLVVQEGQLALRKRERPRRFIVLSIAERQTQS